MLNHQILSLWRLFNDKLSTTVCVNMLLWEKWGMSSLLHGYISIRLSHFLACVFFFHSFIGYYSCNIQYTFIIQHTQKKEKKQKPKRGRCNGTNVLCEAPPLDQDQAQASTRLGLKLKKISWSPIGNVLERHSHQMHIISCQFVLWKAYLGLAESVQNCHMVSGHLGQRGKNLPSSMSPAINSALIFSLAVVINMHFFPIQSISLLINMTSSQGNSIDHVDHHCCEKWTIC